MIVESNADQVCGTDGLSYPSECQLQIAACKKQQYIVVANKGECGKFCTPIFSKIFFCLLSSSLLYLFRDREVGSISENEVVCDFSRLPSLCLSVCTLYNIIRSKLIQCERWSR